MAIEALDQQKHPEGLTEEQEKLLDSLFTTGIKARTRRRMGAPGNYNFIEAIRDTYPIDFAKEGEFALKDHEKNPSAPLSPVLLNLRNLPEELVHEIGKNLAKVRLSQLPDLCTGIPSAGEALAEAYSKFSGVPFKKVFHKEEARDKRSIIINPNVDQCVGKLLIIDDTISEGHSSFEVIEAVRSLPHLEISGFLFVADREQGGAEVLKALGHKVDFIYKFKSQILPCGLRRGMVSQIRYDESRNYFASFKR